jgi:hypothetical protein
MSILHANQTRETLTEVAPILRLATSRALKATRFDQSSIRPGFVGYGGVSFVVDTPMLPVIDVALERVCDEEQRDGVRLRIERRDNGSRVPVIDLVLRQAYSFSWLYEYALAQTADGDIVFVPMGGPGPVIELSVGALRRARGRLIDFDRVLSLDGGSRFLSSLIRGC